METLKASIVQAQIEWHKPEKNLQHFDELISNTKGSDLILLPEMWSTGFTMKAHLFQSYADPAVDLMKKWSNQTGAAVAGSLIVEEGGKNYNRLYFVHEGEVLDQYDKKHLFAYSGEDRSFQPGKEKKIVEFKSWKICLNICYDLRFPVWARNYEDYDLLFYSANWPDARNLAWSSLLRARAIENQSYVIGVNCCGNDAWHNSYSGHSMAINYDGSLCTEIDLGEQLITVELDRARLKKFRADFPFLQDRDPIELL